MRASSTSRGPRSWPTPLATRGCARARCSARAPSTAAACSNSVRSRATASSSPGTPWPSRPRDLADSRPASRKRHLSRFVSVRLLNPIAKPLAERGLLGKSVCVLETTGRKSGQARRTPVGDGLRGDTFWIVAEHGRGAAYVKNIEANPRVRVKAGRLPWREGTAHILPEDDPHERMRMLKQRGNDLAVRLNATALLVIPIDLAQAYTRAPIGPPPIFQPLCMIVVSNGVASAPEASTAISPPSSMPLTAAAHAFSSERPPSRTSADTSCATERLTTSSPFPVAETATWRSA